MNDQKPSSWSRTGEKIIDFKLVNKFAPLFDIRSNIAYKNIENDLLTVLIYNSLCVSAYRTAARTEK